MTPPDALARLGSAVAERANPIVVKEVRQGLRTRGFWIFFGLLLAACLLVSLVAAAVEADDGGQMVFGGTAVCLVVVLCFIIPFSAFRAMAREREEETWALLALTGLSPRRILAGKIGSALVQGGLYTSAAAPFLLFSYELNGVSLPAIGLALGLMGAAHAFLVTLAVAAGTMANSRLARGLLRLVASFFLVGFLFFGISWTAALLFSPFMRPARLELGAGLAAAAFVLASTAALAFEAAAARLSLDTEPYARGPRLAFLAQWLGGVVMCAVFWRVTRDGDALVLGQVLSSLYAGLVGLFIASDKDGLARAHWATGRRSLLAAGALRGFLLVVLGLAASSAALYALSRLGKPLHAGRYVLTAAPAYALLYLSAALVVARWIPHPPAQAPLVTRVVFLGLLMLGTLGPPLLGAAISSASDVVLNVFNPVVGLDNLADGRTHAKELRLVLWATAGGMAAWAFAALRARDVPR